MKLFKCESIIMGKEYHKDGGDHYHIGVLNGSASQNNATPRIREAFPARIWGVSMLHPVPQGVEQGVWVCHKGGQEGGGGSPDILERAKASEKKRRCKTDRVQRVLFMTWHAGHKGIDLSTPLFIIIKAPSWQFVDSGTQVQGH